jgi:hypothetical protein
MPYGTTAGNQASDSRVDPQQIVLNWRIFYRCGSKYRRQTTPLLLSTGSNHPRTELRQMDRPGLHNAAWSSTIVANRYPSILHQTTWTCFLLILLLVTHMDSIIAEKQTHIDCVPQICDNAHSRPQATLIDVWREA